MLLQIFKIRVCKDMIINAMRICGVIDTVHIANTSRHFKVQSHLVIFTAHKGQMTKRLQLLILSSCFCQKLCMLSMYACRCRSCLTLNEELSEKSSAFRFLLDIGRDQQRYVG